VRLCAFLGYTGWRRKSPVTSDTRWRSRRCSVEAVAGVVHIAQGRAGRPNLISCCCRRPSIDKSSQLPITRAD